MTTQTRWTVAIAGVRVDMILAAIVLAALAVRVERGITREYIHDEINNLIPLAKTISLVPGRIHLPLRGENHGALPAYVVKASGTLFGTSRLGYRTLHIIGGLVIVVLMFRLTREWYGAVAARWAAALLAFNEYFVNVSSRVTAHVPMLLLVAAALYSFSRLLATGRVRYLYASAAAVGLAFYCKESTALLVPVFGLTLLLPPNRRWFRSVHVYLAAALFAIMLAPDIYWNATSDPRVLVTYGDQPARQARYTSHMKRIGGLGFSPYPLMFYGRAAVMPAYRLITGHELRDETAEYESMNPVLGALLLATVLYTTFQRRRGDRIRPMLLLLFWLVFGFFSLIEKGNPPGRLDPVSWFWVETTILAAVVCAGARLAEPAGRWRIGTWTLGVAAVLYAVWMTV